jgi:hypothetical protein
MTGRLSAGAAPTDWNPNGILARSINKEHFFFNQACSSNFCVVDLPSFDQTQPEFGVNSLEG